jgi:secreted PhoX family phosphatase
MSHSYRKEDTLNPSSNPSFSQVLESRLSRRDLLKGAAAAAVTASLPLAGCAGVAGRREPAPGFTGISTSTADAVRVPQGYTASVLYAWGDPVGHPSGSPAFRPDAGNTADEQALQAGMHHDGIHYFPLPYGSKSSSSGLLVMNHEYTDDGLLHADGFAHWSAEKVRKSQNAHGCSVIEVRSRDGQWEVVRPSPFARRITAATPMRIAGPAAGHDLMKTAADPSGTRVLGTFNDCAHGYTPWGTYLACEENWDTYFVNSGTLTADQRRNGITAKGRGYRWDEFDERFDAGKHPHEPNRHGWVVEFDPYNPQSQPVKRTALGRFSHEGAWPAMATDGRLVMYMGDDRVFEYIYKFVSRDRVNPNDRKANANLLDHGTLYVARFSDDGGGEWLPLTHGAGALTAANGFADQADVLVRTRAAADAAGATRMDRPEWIAVHPQTQEVYCTLTNNSQRGGKDRPGIDRANPRANNVFGQIIRWRETGNDPAATRFEWDLFAVAGDPQHPDAARRGNIRGDAYGSPDGLWFDESGLLWIQTDVSSSTLGKGHYERLGNNMMLAADVRSGETRRFLTGPSGCEVTGMIMTPDARTLFVNIQHPGESPSERSDPKNPRAYSSWPDGGRPRSATVVIRRSDGGVIGS